MWHATVYKVSGGGHIMVLHTGKRPPKVAGHRPLFSCSNEDFIIATIKGERTAKQKGITSFLRLDAK